MTTHTSVIVITSRILRLIKKNVDELLSNIE